MAKKKTSQEIEETSLGNDDLIRISKESGGSYSNRKIKGSNMKASLSPDLNENEIAFGNSSNKITSSSRLLYEDGALIVVHNGTGENVKLENTAGRKYTLISTGTGSGIGANKFAIFDATNGLNRFEIQEDGKIKINDSYILPEAEGSENDLLQLNSSNLLEWKTPAQVRGYKLFLASMSQTSTNPPTIDQLYVNEVGIEPSDITYDSAGIYLISKTGIGINFAKQGGVLTSSCVYYVSYASDDLLKLTVHNNNTPTDDILANNLIEIKFLL